ncbi:hypothetical protein HMPREF3200_01495 [Anaerococcus tetradius]|uniref:Uncharacterized protein n=1 Tax=Anaerococcus tetradius TaxID=33036 RepID=A0A133KCQ6_9FIRM|nr:hypothetical protein HMPREF3200_01495 [Anaerococcus tetradius]
MSLTQFIEDELMVGQPSSFPKREKLDWLESYDVRFGIRSSN